MTDEFIASVLLDAIEREWAAHDALCDSDAPTWDEAAYEASYARRERLLDAADRLPATSRQTRCVKALALAWLDYVHLWERGKARGDYALDGRLALDVQASVLAAARAGRREAQPCA